MAVKTLGSSPTPELLNPVTQEPTPINPAGLRPRKPGAEGGGGEDAARGRADGAHVRRRHQRRGGAQGWEHALFVDIRWLDVCLRGASGERAALPCMRQCMAHAAVRHQGWERLRTCVQSAACCTFPEGRTTVKLALSC